MAEVRRCILVLVCATAGLLSVSGTGSTSKYVCPGDSVKAFENIDFDRCNASVFLSRNGNRNIQIATWSLRNCTLNASLENDYTERVFLDQNGTITIHNFHHFDQGKYVVISKKDVMPSIQEVQLFAMVAPSKNCKPMIKPLGNTLFASLNSDDCGIPVATTYWKGYDGVSDTNTQLLKITPGHESRTYFACIEGLALQCARDQMPLDHCSPFFVERNTTPTVPSESSNTLVYIAIIIFVGILLILAIAVIVILIRKRRRRRRLQGKLTEGLMDETYRQETHLGRLQGKLTEGLMDSTLREETHLDTQRSLSNDPQLPLGTRSDSDYEMNEVGTDLQSGIDPETIRELQELRDAARCKICFAHKASVVFMPCKHVATCDECSIPLHTCPVCRETIKERKRICFDSNE